MTTCILIISVATGQPLGCVSPSEIVKMMTPTALGAVNQSS